MEQEEDFLEVDTPINGQKYCLLSFVSPEKMLKQKNLFAFHKYLKHRHQETENKNNNNNNNNKQGDEVEEKDYDLTFDKFTETYNTFLYAHQENIDSEFNELVDFRTSVRGLKVRGVYETYREAKVKAARLQKVDRTFHVFIGQVGYWLPWDPEPDGIEDQEYLNKQLNNLVHEYQKNQEYRDEVFGDRVQHSKDESRREVEENRSSNANPSLDVNEDHPLQSNKTATLSDTNDALQGEDPWMARKNAEDEVNVEEQNGDRPRVLEI
tara:strand:+ start:2047 stop:2847 length:801 start_codon:yes stop_codon:yes gene_type:complete